ncbi:MAG: S8 family serine peptidase [Candidatus Eremiobacteraeota bacterium]|nr:S8 family serine peptidase [Candidatus Eremiobacteraeota bacterium]
MSLQRIDGMFRHAWPGTHPGRPFDAEERAHVTVWFAREAGARLDAERAIRIGALPIGEREYETRAAFRARTDAPDRLYAELERYAASHALEIIARHWRSAVRRGRLADLTAAFGANLEIRTSPHGDPFRHREGWLHLPEHLAKHVHGAFGLHAWYRDARVEDPTLVGVPLPPAAVEKLYAFPAARGRNQTIGILAYAATHRESDYELAMRRLGIRRSDPIVKHVDGEHAVHEAARGADLEAATDVQIAAALAPEARIVVYEAPHDERGCLDAVRTAIFDEEYAPSVLSISYGIIERNWTRASLEILEELFVAAALLGISIFVASGDNGAELDGGGQPHVNAPASSPYVIACGATRVRGEGSKRAEVAWHRTGGGFGRAPVPAWQKAAQAWAERHGLRAGRGVPDVSAQCDPGYPVYFDGKELAMHGTSTIAPLWAALAARIDETATHRLGPAQTIGFFAPILYARSEELMRPITSGGNGYFEARAGWNPCAGLGVPDGSALERVLVRATS